MIKYQISAHVKNNELPELIRGEDYKPEVFYLINFKGIFDSIEEGCEYIRDTFKKIIKEKDICSADILRSIHITKIDTDRCKKWQKLFFKTN